MAKEISIEVGDLHAGLHNQLVEMLGEKYEAKIRDEMESLIHDSYREVERVQEQQDATTESNEIDLDEA
jgi:hypothetical protein